MKLLKAVFAGTAFTFLLSISGSTQELTSVPKQSPAPILWEIELTSTGGFHGLGEGGITIKSNGTATVNDLDKSCVLQIPPEAVQELERSLTDWESGFRNAAATNLKQGDAQPVVNSVSSCCDLIKYSLRIKFSGSDQVESRYSESWYQYLDGALPKSLNLVRTTSLQLRDSMLSKCKG